MAKTSELTGAALDWAVAKCEFGYGTDGLTNRYSTNWAQGGPIVERENISVMWSLDDVWHACTGFSALGHSLGPTPLIAAMRCYVASKLGDEVDVPKELL